MQTLRSRAAAILTLTVLTLTFLATGAQAAPPAAADSLAADPAAATHLLADPAIHQALEQLRSATRAGLTADSEDRRVPAADRADAFVTGKVLVVGDLDFLSDGTPFRIVAVQDRKPILQNVFMTCLGPGFSTACGRLVPGRRVSFNSWILVLQDGDSAGLALLVATRVQI